MNSILPLLAELRQTGLVVRRDFFALDRDAFLEFCRTATPGSDPCLHWKFGPVMELKVDECLPNYLFSREEVPFHWDGVFLEVPSVLVFQCLEAPDPGAGGLTRFTNAEGLYEALTPAQRSGWASARITYRTERLAHYGGEATFPLFATHPQKGTPVVRFAEAVSTEKNPVSIQVSGVSAAVGREIVAHFSRALYAAPFCYEHQWRRGDLVLADNHALLHGRSSFLSSSPRHIRRVQLR